MNSSAHPVDRGSIAVPPEIISPSAVSSDVPSRSRRDQRGRASGSQSQGSGSVEPNIPACDRCGRRHTGQCLAGAGAYFGCGKPGHMLRACPAATQGHGRGRDPSTSSSTPPVRSVQ
ncbi:hypothetical protein HAX54_050772 [Datura stramonium]|uniref:CCHC-type domain-containing protein n=1 Tax=Datura stramonium TaxID=4076 RepID=A0ABS8SWU9_DATST|nr:hypothetical protein [Datura stramonium]